MFLAIQLNLVRHYDVPFYSDNIFSPIGSEGIEASYAGGIDGREIIDHFLPKLPVCHVTTS